MYITSRLRKLQCAVMFLGFFSLDAAAENSSLINLEELRSVMPEFYDIVQEGKQLKLPAASGIIRGPFAPTGTIIPLESKIDQISTSLQLCRSISAAQQYISQNRLEDLVYELNLTREWSEVEERCQLSVEIIPPSDLQTVFDLDGAADDLISSNLTDSLRQDLNTEVEVVAFVNKSNQIYRILIYEEFDHSWLDYLTGYIVSGPATREEMIKIFEWHYPLNTGWRNF